MIQGFAHAKNYDELIAKQIIPSKTKLVIPSHHDNLFSSLNEEMEPVVTSDIGLFRKKIKGYSVLLELKIGETKTIIPKLK